MGYVAGGLCMQELLLMMSPIGVGIEAGDQMELGVVFIPLILGGVGVGVLVVTLTGDL